MRQGQGPEIAGLSDPDPDLGFDVDQWLANPTPFVPVTPAVGMVQPGCDVQGEAPPSGATVASSAHDVGVPAQSAALPVDHSQPSCPLHAVVEVSEAHVVSVPVQVELAHEHSYSSSHAVSVALALQGVTVPVQLPAVTMVHVQPGLDSQPASEVKPGQVGVPTHVVPLKVHPDTAVQSAPPGSSEAMYAHESAVPAQLPVPPESVQPGQYAELPHSAPHSSHAA
jgi:hypothetical protein